MKRRILLVDDDLAVLLTLKAVLELHGFDVDTAGSSTEAFARLQSGIYQMVISDLRMETEESGLEVLRIARRQSYNPATALLTAYPPAGNHRGENRGERGGEEDWTAANSDSLLIKPLGTSALLRQVEALLVSHADKSQSNSRNGTPSNSSTSARDRKRHAG